jgi:hypothetical protein
VLEGVLVALRVELWLALGVAVCVSVKVWLDV